MNGRMFIRIQPVKYSRGMNNAVTIYNCTQGFVVPAVSINERRKDLFETIKLFVLRRSCFVGYREHYYYLVKLLIRSLLTACIRMSLLPNA